MKNKINLKGEHAAVRTLGALEQAKIFATKPQGKNKVRNLVQLLKDATLTRTKRGKIVARTQREYSKPPFESRGVPAAYSAAHVLAHILFPKNFPELIATGVKQSRESHSRVVYSKQIKLTKESQSGVDAFYSRKWRDLTPFILHGLEMEKRSPEIIKSLWKAGIIVNSHPINIGARKDGKELCFFEILGINLPMMRETINNLLEKTKMQKLTKKQAQLLLEFLETQPSKEGFITTH